MREGLERIIAAVSQSIAAGDTVPPSAATLLLRRYLRLADAQLRDAIGTALAMGIERSREDPLWIEPLAIATGIAEDERVQTAVLAAAAVLPVTWTRGELAESMRHIDAALRASAALELNPLAQAAIDHLESVVARRYEPGLGIDGNERRADQVWTACALVSGYHATGQVPYAMLADELVGVIRRDGAFAAGLRADPLVMRAALARVLVALDQLHRDPEYRRAATVPPDATYSDEAARVLAEAVPEAGATVDDGAALYGVAVEEYLAACDLQ